MEISLVTVIVAVSNAITTILASALLMLVFWQNPRERINQTFAALMLFTLLYCTFNILTRFVEDLHLQIEVVFYWTITFYGFMAVAMYLFVISFAQVRQHLLYRGVGILMIILNFAFEYFLWNDEIATDFELLTNQTGGYLIQYSALGLIALFISLVYLLLSSLILYRMSLHDGRLRYLSIAPLLIVAGVLWSATGWRYIPIPLTAITLTLAIFMLGYSLLRENLFNPLATITKELVEKNAQLSAANQLKNQFLSNMSHELRTPLNSIINFTELILEEAYGDINPHQANRLEKVVRNGRNLLALINDILDLSRIETGRIELNRRAIEPQEILEQVISVFEPEINAKNLDLIRQYKAVTAIDGDELRIKQIFMNIISNAVKFTARGHLKITLEEKNDTVVCGIEDTGIGIPIDKQTEVFDAFRQIDSGPTREYGGTGLGMNITKRLVELMGGKIWLESKVGKGTTFYVELPKAVAGQVPRRSDITVTQEMRLNAQPKVLIIDDNHDAQILLQDLLVDQGWRTYIASSGRDGLHQANEVYPNLIVLDVMMPNMDGWQVLQEIKKQPPLAEIPVIIVSAIDNRNLAEEMGAYALITKPVDKSQFETVVRQIMTTT